MKLVEFTCQGHRFAVPLTDMRRVVASAAPTPLPGAPGLVMGVLNIGGEIVIIIDFCQRLGLRSSAITATQHIVVLAVPGFLLGLVVDEIGGVTEPAAIAGDALPPECAAHCVTGMLVVEGGLRILLDPAQVLLRAEAQQLRAAIEGVAHGQQ
jgi:chemotaxis signal transduction protein